MLVFQATCVAVNGRALLIEGSPGSGKSLLALSLIDRGGVLVGDDGVVLEPDGDVLFAAPHPNTRGLMEVRNLGLVSMPVCDRAAVALLIELDPEAPRFIEEPEGATLAGVRVPLIRLWPGGESLALKAELALKLYGLCSE